MLEKIFRDIQCSLGNILQNFFSRLNSRAEILKSSSQDPYRSKILFRERVTVLIHLFRELFLDIICALNIQLHSLLCIINIRGHICHLLLKYWCFFCQVKKLIAGKQHSKMKWKLWDYIRKSKISSKQKLSIIVDSSGKMNWFLFLFWVFDIYIKNGNRTVLTFDYLF